MEHSEASLVEEARKGSHDAFSRIVRLHQAQVRGFLSRFVRNDDVVDDLAQETFLSAFRGLGGYKGEAALRTWLLSIARHTALRYLEDLRRRRSRETAGLDAELDLWLAEQAVDGSLEARHQKEMTALESCLKRLPPKSANLVAEFYYQRHPAVEIARMSGKKESAVWMALLRIREALRECVKARLETA